MHYKNNNVRTYVKPLALAISCVSAGAVQAMPFQLENGWEGEWNTTLSVGSQWRAENQDHDLYSGANGALVGKSGGNGGSVDAGNLNYDKGDRVSTIAKFVTDLSLRNGDMGGLVRVKGWYDEALKDEDVNYGSASNGYRKKPLNDDGYADLQKFSGVYLLDAYAYNTWYVDDAPVQVRLGRQVVNWGESAYIQGINQINPLDVPALRRPGTELKEALIPVWMAYMNIGLPAGISMEAFYQLKYEATAIEGCGHYWSVTESAIGQDFGDCQVGTFLGGTNPSSANKIAAGAYLPEIKGKEPRDNGQWGVAFRFPIDALDGELGLYYLNYHSRTPYLGLRSTGSTTLALTEFPNAGQPGAVARNARGEIVGPSWEYPEDIRLYGLSFTTTLAGWSIGSELSYSPNQPAQINGADLLNGALAGVGPAGDLLQLVKVQNSSFTAGWDRYEKTQFQINGVNVFPNVLKAENLTVVAEAGFQWNNIPQSDDDRRYGRGFIYGLGSSPSIPAGGNTCTSPVASLVNTSPAGCKNKGYVTDFAWGYRLRGQLDYNNFLGTSITASPYAFVGQDVDGVSMDGQFNEGRITSALGITFDYNKQQKLDFSYVSFDNSAEYDPLHDRDFYSANYSYSF